MPVGSHARPFSAAGLDAEVARIRHRWPSVALAVGVVRDGHLDAFAGHGFADIASRTPVVAGTAFRVASITKTFTALAAMHLVERGALALDGRANDYLRAFQLLDQHGGPSQATVGHLLTHTAGLPEVTRAAHAVRPDFGESIAAGRPAPTLAQFYGGRLRAGAVPGTTFCYTNHGPATLGQIVEDVTGTPLAEYLREHVFTPLGMHGTDLSQSRRPVAGRATGYRLTTRGPKPVPVRDMVTVGAAAAWSTPEDMARYAGALLAGGSNEHGSALEPHTVQTMFAAHYRPDPRLPGMGLGFFRASIAGHHVVEHQGTIPGFDSYLALAPDDRLAVFSVATGSRLAPFWLPHETTRLLARFLGEDDTLPRTDLPQRPDVWSEICGVYSVPASLTDVRMRSIIGAGVQVLVRRGRLYVRCLHPLPALLHGVELHPDDRDDPYAFRFDLTSSGLGSSRIVFAPHPTGRTAMHLELMPLTAYRRSPRARPVVPAPTRSGDPV